MTATATQATQQAKETAQQAAGQARERVRGQVDRRSSEAGEQAASVADAMRQSAQQLREQGKEGAARPIEQVAERVQRAGSWLSESDGDRLLRDAEDFGRRNPMAVAAAGLAAGFAVSRLLKASSTRRYQQEHGDGGPSPLEQPRTPATSGAYGAPAPPIAPPGPSVATPQPPIATPEPFPVAPGRPDGAGRL
jgi:hypothetical protein